MSRPSPESRQLERDLRRSRTADLFVRLGSEPERREQLLDEVVLVNRGVADAFA